MGGERKGLIRDLIPTTLSDIGVQTSIQFDGKLESVQNNNLPTMEKSKQNGLDTKAKIDNALIDKLNVELDMAKEKIKVLEEKHLDAEKRRAIEISSKYVPTSFARYYHKHFHSRVKGTIFLNISDTSL